MTSAQPSLLIKTDTAPKLGLRAQGTIGYRILTDERHTEIFLAVVANQGGAGLFSKENVAFSRVEQCVKGLGRDKPLPSKTFKAAFAVGRSQNDSGFLAAILRHEKLLEPASGSRFLHVVSGDWSAWKSTTLAQTAEPLSGPDEAFLPASASTISNAEETGGMEPGRGARLRKRSGDKHHHPSTEPSDASTQ